MSIVQVIDWLKNKDVLDLINQCVLLLLAFSTLIGILNFIGMLPPKVQNFFRLNRAEDTIKALTSLGFDLEKYRRIIQANQFPKEFAPKEITKVTRKTLKRYKIKKMISVGRHRRTSVSCYYDLIGGSCKPEVAKYFAKILSTYWSMHSQDPLKIHHADFDFVVTPKSGSPILGYEFAAIAGKPLVLYEESERFQTGDLDMRSHFDCYEVPERNSIALIVDDSTTGGDRVCNVVNALRDYGYRVYTCLVVFAPQVKNADKRLAQKQIQLLSVVKTHQKVRLLCTLQRRIDNG